VPGQAAAVPFSHGGQVDGPKRALHALNRLGFGPRPGDVQRVLETGVDQWAEQQLAPEQIPDTGMDARLAPLRTLSMTVPQINASFPTKLMIRNVARGRRSMPADPYERAVYQVQVDRYEDRYRTRAVDGGAAPQGSDSEVGGGDDDTPGGQDGPRDRAAQERAAAKAAALEALPADRRMKEILSLPPAEQRALADLDEEKRVRLMAEMSPRDRETFVAMGGDASQGPVDELIEAKVLRAIYSERQLYEVMVDFWFNHFNVFVGKGADAFETTVYERDVIRPHALGKFEDLLVATAKSPAMLVYLDNWESVGAGSVLGKNVPADSPRRLYHRRRHDLNENYGRELLELHTLGVDGGYTQKDVTELARAFTGWTVTVQREDSAYKFDDRMHDPGSKTVLGHAIAEGGEKEGLDALHMLAHHPSTARFISKKLAMRFVSDDPPAPLVDRMADTFLRSGGEIREVIRTMLRSPEFWAPQAYRAKAKTPLEFVVSCVRATGFDVRDAQPLGRAIAELGMPLFGMPPPTGYSMKASAWINSAALLGRIRFANSLTKGGVRGTVADQHRIAGAQPASSASATIAALEGSMLGGDVTPPTHEAVSKQAGGPSGQPDGSNSGTDLGAIAELILESPEFERR
jgi:uncharacterized protein (DUF1800 family)